MSPATSPPIGFKEWSYICEALGQGVQTIILRKGGIHEGKGGFHFQHDAFWLFPTGFHNQGELLRWTPPDFEEVTVPRDEQREHVNIRYFAKLHRVWKLTVWDKVAALASFHVWNEQTIRDRFAWNEESCLHVALVRVFKLPQPWTFPYQPGYGGCRSWVKLPGPERTRLELAEGLPEEVRTLEDKLTPVMGDVAWEDMAEKVSQMLA